MSSSRFHVSPGALALVIRAVRSLTPEQADTVEALIARHSRCQWSLDTHMDYDGYLSFVVTPNDASIDEALLLSGEIGKVTLERMHGDDMRSLGTFDRFDVAVSRVLAYVEEHGAFQS